MGTNYIAPIWRMPENTNKDKLSNYSINFSGATRTHIGIGEVVGGPLLPGGQTYTSNVTVQNPKFSGSAFINFNTDSTYPIRKIVGVGQTGGASFWYLQKNASNNIEFIARTDAGSPYYATVTGSTVLSPNQWYHAAFSWNGNTITLYLNGSVDGSGSATTFYNSSFQYSGWASIGSYWRGGSSINTLWVGKMSQVCVFDYDLSVEQITYLQNLNNPMAISGSKPVAYWPLGDNSNPTASAGYPNISVGADSVFDFDRTNVEITTAYGVPVTTFTECTFSAWVKFETVTGTYQYVMGMGSADNSASSFMSISKNQNSGTWYTYSGGSGSKQCATTPVANRWYHVVVTQTGTVRRFYVDGVEDTNSPFTVNALTSTAIAYDNLTLGAYDPNSPTSSNPLYGLDGQLSNVQVWDKKIEQADVTTLYNNGQPLMTGTQPQAANLKAWYKLNQHESHWSIGGNSKWVMEDNSSPYTKSFSFDNTTPSQDYFETGRGPRGMNTNVGTYSCWINLNSVAGNQVFMDVPGFASREFMNLKIRSNNALQMEMRSWGIQMLWDSVTTTPFEVGKWYHVVAVGDGTNIKMYINGDEISTYIASGSYRWWSYFNTSLTYNSGYEIQVGAGSYPVRHSPIDGRISNAQIWNTDLSTSQVETLYNGGHPLQGTQPAQANLLGWYKLNQDSSWRNYNYWNNILVNKWTNINSAITTTPPTESFGFSGGLQDGNDEGWEVTNKSISGSLLLSMWYKTTGDSVNTWTFNNDGSGDVNSGQVSLRANGYVYVFSPDASSRGYKRAIPTTDYNWHNLIIYVPNGSPTYDATGIKIWQNGVDLGPLDFTGSASTTFDAFTEIIGMNRNSSSTYNGTGTQWSNWALFENVTPTDSVIDAIFNKGTPSDISSLNPSVWYKLNSTDTTFGTTGSKATALSIIDSSSNNNNATGPYDYDAATNVRPVIITGNVENAIAGLNMSGNELTDFSVSARDGESSGMNTTNIVQSNLTRKVPYSSYSTSFLGTANRYEVGTTSLGITSAITVSAWVKIPTTNTGGPAPNIQQLICEDATSSSNRNWALNWRGGSFLVFSFSVWHTDGTVSSISTTGITPNNGLWQHVVGTFDGTTNAGGVRIYVDGQQAQTPVTAVSTGVKSTSAVEPSIGGLSKNNAWELEGHISNCAVWESAITDDDAINLYNNGITQDLNNFRITPDHWWPLDENSTYFNGSVLVARDTISGRDGTGVNLIQSDIEGNAPGSDTNGTGSNMAGIVDLKGNMISSSNNSYSINMADYADGVTNPANSGRSTDTPS